MTQTSLSVASESVPFVTFPSASAYLAITTILSWMLHAMVFYIMATDKKLHSPINTVLTNLAVSDFCIAFFGNPIALTCAFTRNWIFGDALCVTYGFLMGLFGITSIITLTVLAFERYLIICCPFSSRAHFTSNGAKLSVIGIWMYALMLTTPPLFGWGEYGLEAAHISCAVNWETRSPNAQSYIIFLFVLALIIPLLVICFSYLQIVRVVSRAQRAQNKMNSAAGYKKKDGHVAVMIFLMIVMFLFAWGPYAIASAIVAATDWYVSPFFAIFPSLFAKGSCCFNPIIYFLFNPMFRNSLKDKLGLTEKIIDRESPEARHANMDDKPDTRLLQATDAADSIRKTSIVSVTSSVSNSSDIQLQHTGTGSSPKKTIIIPTTANQKAPLYLGIGNSKIQTENDESELEPMVK